MAIIDDKSEHCIPFLLTRLNEHKAKHGTNGKPFFVGLNGVQGAGKTTLVSALRETLESPSHNLRLAVISLDDFYLTHANQVALAKSHPSNPLVQHRGQPSTHDIKLLTETLESLAARQATSLPVYDKALHAGAGDRAHESQWHRLEEGQDVVMLEGWCVGFKALSESALKEKWQAARDLEAAGKGTGQLGKLKFDDVKFVNDALREYEPVWDAFDAFVHIDAAELEWVYDWRLEAEVKMRELKGAENAMTDDEVKRFVDGYYPAYEVYTETLRNGIFEGEGKQMRIVVGKDRRVQDVTQT